ncbi:restriction endonuclease subunit S [Paenibacillus alginolyticus]|uniref:restriction endonuclease subunit S n=1 Tax=Paenibacillus alginolyticus TaxID=59839 RepID=UPI000424690C|nr:restriction endonuclease subunit S [Paenibacillus alginolyticus]MCY9670573.1 restriction endonuclease subunit S [Paenibacillus alginolyticus]
MAGKDGKPDIRFSGFTDAWEQRKLGEIYTERNERGDDSLQILSVSIHHGISNEELDSNTLGKKVRRSEDKTLYKHVYFGDLVLNMMRAWQGAIGVVKSEGMVSPAYITAIPSTQLYPLFMDYCLRRDETIIQMNNLSYGVTDFRKRLYWDSFINVMCRIPSVPEQERITAFITNLDKLITLHQRKYDKLVIVKKSMLEKMFPKDGANVPEIRFSGFTDDWEQRELGELGETYTGLSGKTKDDFGHGNGKFVTYMNVYSNPIAKLSLTEPIEVDSKQNEVRFGDVFFTTSSEIPEEVGMSSVWLENSNNTYLNSFCFGYRPIEKLDHYYLAYMLRSSCVRGKITFLAQGISRYNISKNKLMGIDIPIPNIEEQAQIGGFFKRLDNLITLHRSKLEKLKNIKKAMLEKMFV